MTVGRGSWRHQSKGRQGVSAIVSSAVVAWSGRTDRKRGKRVTTTTWCGSPCPIPVCARAHAHGLFDQSLTSCAFLNPASRLLRRTGGGVAERWDDRLVSRESSVRFLFRSPFIFKRKGVGTPSCDIPPPPYWWNTKMAPTAAHPNEESFWWRCSVVLVFLSPHCPQTNVPGDNLVLCKSNEQTKLGRSIYGILLSLLFWRWA